MNRVKKAALAATVAIGLAGAYQAPGVSEVVDRGFRFRFTEVVTPSGDATNPISSSRHAAAVWAGAGVEGGIPTTRTRCTTGTGTSVLASSSTVAQINTAIDGCDANHFVELGSGTFSLGNKLELITDNPITLKGQGANLTKLTWTGSPDSGCHLGFGFGIKVCGPGEDNIGSDAPPHTATWSAGYALGTTVITLSSTTGLVAGTSIIWLDQLDNAAGGSYTDLDMCGACYRVAGGNNYVRSNRGQTVGHRVTAVNGSAVTIEPALYLPNWRSGQSPGAWWGDIDDVADYVGIEDLSVDAGNTEFGILLANCANCWIKGVRVFYDEDAAGTIRLINLLNCFHCTVESSYTYGPNTSANSNYQIATDVVSSSLLQNNILAHVVSGLVTDGPTFGTVFSYNFGIDSYYTGPCFINHSVAAFLLMEGNNCVGGRSDVTHSTSNFLTHFRNHYDGKKNSDPANVETIFTLESRQRFHNVVGNVLGDATYIADYETDQAQNWDDGVYELGWKGSSSGTDPGNDSLVKSTLFRWGNWDTLTNATRWCGASGNTGFATTCSSTTEVPSGITNYPQSLPSAETLPSSLYLTAKPSWFQSIAWPPIGPDISTGAIAGYASHAHKIPARVCLESLSDDAGYGGTLKTFNRVTCYGA